MIKVAKNWPY